MPRVEKKDPTPISGVTDQPSSPGLPTDLVQDASRRLGGACLFYVVTFTLAYFGSPFVLWLTEGKFPEHVLGVQSIIALVSIFLAIALFYFSRTTRMRPDLLLDIGLVFEVVGAFGISMSQFWGIFPEWSDEFFRSGYVGIPWECTWILLFPVMAPNKPGKALLASLGAASTGPLTILLSYHFGPTSPDTPLGFLFRYFLFTTYLCAGLAFLVSRTIYRLGAHVKRARDIGSYRLMGLLGRGGMGEVWVAEHRMLARPAAIKLIRPEALGFDDTIRQPVVRRFKREAQATAMLQSAHTVDLYDFGLANNGSFYYVMELLNGLDLQALIKRFGPVPAERTIHFLRQACHSLAEAHHAGLIHRDIKPANIYACRQGLEFDFVKILDFGLVKAFEGKGEWEMGLTAVHTTSGTPAYMPPEVALGKSDIDGRSDLYSLGCVGYWLLTGQMVFEGETPMQVIVHHVQTPPIPPSERTETEIPADLEEVILACLKKEPADRPPDARELDALLARCETAPGWTNEKARRWWELHLPKPAPADD